MTLDRKGTRSSDTARVHFVYVLYKREPKLYYFIRLSAGNGYELLLQSFQEAKLSIDQIVALAQNALKEITYGRRDQFQGTKEANYQEAKIKHVCTLKIASKEGTN